MGKQDNNWKKRCQKYKLRLKPLKKYCKFASTLKWYSNILNLRHIILTQNLHIEVNVWKLQCTHTSILTHSHLFYFPIFSTIFSRKYFLDLSILISFEFSFFGLVKIFKFASAEKWTHIRRAIVTKFVKHHIQLRFVR